MSTVDQFESVFKAAAKTTYQHEKPALGKVVLVTDLEDAEANLFLHSVREYFASTLPDGDSDWVVLSSGAYGSVKELLGKVEELRPDLLVTYRNLGSESWRWPYSLGEYLDVLTQVTTTPVLVLPHPDRDDCAEILAGKLGNVMAVSGHLCGEGTLIRYASAFAPEGGRLILSHVEDKATLDRYLDAIDKIPEIDSEVAREFLLDRMLRDAKDFSESARIGLEEAGREIEVECKAQVGRRLEDYRTLIEDGQVDLLVMHAKEEDQMAMHGMAHPLAIELRSVPILLL
mgnify:FL=1